MRLLVAALLLAGCAQQDVAAPRAYPDYRAALITLVQQAFLDGPNASAPADVRTAYEECGADYVLSGFSADERTKLDAWARRDITLTDSELRDLDAKVRSRLGGNLTYESLDRLSAVCPDKVPLFKQYLKP